MAESLLLLLALVWGTSYGVSKQALLWVPVAGLLVWRFSLTWLLLLPAQWRALRQAPGEALRLGLPLGLLLAAILLCETQGVKLTSAANAAVLISVCVVLTPLVEWGLAGRAPAPALWLAAVLCCAGTVLLAGAGSLHLQLSAGDAWMLGAAALRALMNGVSQRLLQASRLSSLAVTGLQSAVVALVCLVLLALQPVPWPAPPAAAGFWLALAYLVGGCTLLALWIQNWALRRCSASRVALLTGSEPLFGAVFAVLALGERLSWQAVGGMALILAATLWASFDRARHRRPPRPASACRAAG